MTRFFMQLLQTYARHSLGQRADACMRPTNLQVTSCDLKASATHIQVSKRACALFAVCNAHKHDLCQPCDVTTALSWLSPLDTKLVDHLVSWSTAVVAPAVAAAAAAAAAAAVAVVVVVVVVAVIVLLLVGVW